MVLYCLHNFNWIRFRRICLHFKRIMEKWCKNILYKNCMCWSCWKCSALNYFDLDKQISFLWKSTIHFDIYTIPN